MSLQSEGLLNHMLRLRLRSISVDGQGHYKPDRSEDLWGKAARLE